MSDETSKGKGPTRSVTDVSAEAERIIGVSTAAWFQPGIEDSTAESLGFKGEVAERMHNGGFTLAELERLQAKRAVGPHQPVPTGTSLLS